MSPTHRSKKKCSQVHVGMQEYSMSTKVLLFIYIFFKFLTASTNGTVEDQELYRHALGARIMLQLEDVMAAIRAS